MNDLEETKQLLHSVVKLLNDSVSDRKQQADMMLGLLNESEERINNVNKMVADITSVMKELTEKYVHHLDRCCDNRDSLTAQNAKLLDVIAKQEETIRIERERCAEILKHLVQVAQNSKADTSINVH